MECKKDLKYCCESFKLYDLDITEKLGNGFSAVVYQADAYKDNKKIDNIVIKIITPPKSKYGFNSLLDENEQSLYMSSIGIGPKVHCIFYKIDKSTVSLYIVMEKMDFTVDELLKGSLSTEEKIKLVQNMISLFHDSVYKYKIYCSDIHPRNFMVSFSGKKMKMKMIDFGSKFCTRNYKKNIDIFYHIVLICLYVQIDIKYSIKLQNLLYKYTKNNIFSMYELISNSHILRPYIDIKGKIIRNIFVFYYFLNKIGLNDSLFVLNKSIYQKYNNKLKPFRNINDIKILKKNIHNIIEDKAPNYVIYKHISYIEDKLHYDTLSKNDYRVEYHDEFIRISMFEIYVLLEHILKYYSNYVPINDTWTIVKIIIEDVDIMLLYKPYDIICTLLKYYADISILKDFYEIHEELDLYISNLIKNII